MTDSSHDRKPDDEPIIELGALDEDRLAALLDNPLLWEEPDPASADAIVAAIGAEAAIGGVEESGSPVSSLEEARARRKSRRWFQPALGAVAGAAVAVLVLAVLPQLRSDPAPTGLELALEATDLAPEATAEIIVVEGRLGTRIDLDVAGLEPAPPGTYYEAWLRQGPEVGVSAGTFHLRGGDGQVELWAGVSPSDYPLFTITIQEQAQEESSGRVVLRGLLSSS